MYMPCMPNFAFPINIIYRSYGTLVSTFSAEKKNWPCCIWNQLVAKMAVIFGGANTCVLLMFVINIYEHIYSHRETGNLSLYALLRYITFCCEWHFMWGNLHMYNVACPMESKYHRIKQARVWPWTPIVYITTVSLHCVWDTFTCNETI